MSFYIDKQFRCGPAEQEAGDEATGAEDRQVKEQVRTADDKAGCYQLSDVMAKAAGTADADEGKAAAFLEKEHSGKTHEAARKTIKENRRAAAK
jgi:hypothetical protein